MDDGAFSLLLRLPDAGKYIPLLPGVAKRAREYRIVHDMNLKPATGAGVEQDHESTQPTLILDYFRYDAP